MNKTAIALKSQLEFGLGDRLAKSLHVAGISTTEMASELEMSRATISNYLNDHTKPKRLYLKMWARLKPRYPTCMRLILSHKTFQQENPEQIVVEGADYEKLLEQAKALIPEGRIASSVRTEK